MRIIAFGLGLFLTLSSSDAKYPLDLGNGLKMDYDGNSYFYIINKKNRVIIKPHITRYDFDEHFVVIEQKPTDIILKDAYSGPKIKLQEINETFNESHLLQYWIIKKDNNKVLGPLSLKEYIQQRRLLGVSSSTKL